MSNRESSENRYGKQKPKKGTETEKKDQNESSETLGLRKQTERIRLRYYPKAFKKSLPNIMATPTMRW